jgi:hypothetical protein
MALGAPTEGRGIYQSKLDPGVDLFIEHFERQCAAAQHHVVKAFSVEALNRDPSATRARSRAARMLIMPTL